MGYGGRNNVTEDVVAYVKENAWKSEDELVQDIYDEFGKEFAPRNRLSRYRYWLSVKCVSSSKRMVSYSAP